jgi:hypothetical protein
MAITGQTLTQLFMLFAQNLMTPARRANTAVAVNIMSRSNKAHSLRPKWRETSLNRHTTVPDSKAA